MNTANRNDVWAAGNDYDPYIGRWSRKVAPEFLKWFAAGEGKAWLDVGCGTGALCGTILAMSCPKSVRGIDPSPEFISFADSKLGGAGAKFEVGDAQAIPVADGCVDVTVSALVLNFVPQPERAMAEMIRVTRPGGKIGLYVWDYAEGMELIRRFWDAAVALDVAATERDEARRFPLCAPAPLEALLQGAGLERVEVTAIEVPSVFRDFDDLWTPFLGGQGPAPGYVASLDETRRAALRDRLRLSLPIAADGSIALKARAWAARGCVPRAK